MMFMPIFSPAASGGISTLSFHDVAYSITDQITAPAGLQSGDLMVLSDLSQGPATLVTPSGFTNWIDLAGLLSRLAVSYKIATGSETTLTGMDGGGSGNNAKTLAIFRPDAAISMITASTPTTENTGGNPSPQSIVATAGAAPLVALGFYAVGFWPDTIGTRSMTPAATGELVDTGNSVTWHYVKYLLQNGTLSDVTIDSNDESSDNFLAGGWLSVS